VTPLTPRQAYWWLRGWLTPSKAHGTKVAYHLASARKAKAAMERKTGRRFDVYWCPWCLPGLRFHIGGSVRR